jgi:hypothetical protein
MRVFLYIVHIFTEVKSVNFLNILILLSQVNLINGDEENDLVLLQNNKQMKIKLKNT